MATPTRKNANKSSIWDYFQISKDDQAIIICQIESEGKKCLHEILRGDNSAHFNTSNARRHIKIKHPQIEDLSVKAKNIY